MSKTFLSRIFCPSLFSLLFLLPNISFGSLSYSGRLVNANGSPVAGPVNLLVELSYTNAPSTILCSQNFSNIALSNGVFHLKLDLNCGASTLPDIFLAVPAGEAAALRVTDITHSKTYSFQAVYSMPFANISETAKQLVQMGATNGQVLKWNDTSKKWEPGAPGSSGSVTNVSANAPLSVAASSSTPTISISQANGTTDGYLSAADWTTFNSKQGTIVAGTSAQYYRGDKTWQSLDTSAVAENIANLYFTNARALGVPLTSFSVGSGAITNSDTIISAFGKAQGQIDSLNTASANYLVKNSTDTISGVVNVGTTGLLQLGYAPVGLTDAANKAYVDTKLDLTGGTVTGDVSFNTQLKLKNGGASNYVTIKAPATGTTAYTLSLPLTAGSANQVLTTDGSGLTSWTTPSTTATPSGAAGGDLTGTYPNPTIGAGKIVDSNVSASAAIAQSKIANLTTDLANRELSANVPADVRATTLTGYVAGINTSITASDTVLSAFENTQAQLNAKEAAIAAGTTAQYYRGDKSWQTLDSSVVPENTNLYFTNARTLGVPLTGFAASNSAIVATDSVLAGFNKAQGQINNLVTSKASLSGDIFTGDVAFNTQIKLRDSSTNYIQIKAPAVVPTTYTITLPSNAGTNGQFLQTDGTGYTTWATIPSAPVTSVNTKTGAVVLTTTDIAEGTNLYFTDARAVAASLTGLTVTNATIAATDSVLVGLGKAQGQISSLSTSVSGKEPAITAGTSAQYWRGDKTWQTLDTSAIPENTNLYFTNSRTLGVPLSGFSTSTGSIVATDTVLQAFGKIQGQLNSKANSSSIVDWSIAGPEVVDPSRLNLGVGNISKALATDANGFIVASPTTSTELGYLSGATSNVQTQLNAKQSTITKTSVLPVSKVQIYGANATNYVELSVPTLASNVAFNFPTSNGTANQVLQTDGSGNTSWVAIPSAPVSSVNTKTGAVVLTTTDIAEGTNLYFTDARSIAAPLTGLTATNATIAATDSVLVGLGKAQGQISSLSASVSGKEPTITAGTTAQYWRGDKTWQTLDTSAVAENTNLYFTNARTLGATLTGFSANNSSIVATDSILAAFGKTQGQLNNKLDSASFVDWSVAGLATIDPSRLKLTSPSKAMVTDANGFVTASSVSATELGYLSGVTSSVQTQLDSKLAKAGGTMSGALSLDATLKIKGGNANYVTLTGHASTNAYTLTLPQALGSAGSLLQTDASGNLSWLGLPTCAAGEVLKSNGSTFSCVVDQNTEYNGTSNRAIVSASNGALTSSDTTDTEIGYVHGVTSNIQTQLDSKEIAANVPADVRATTLSGLSAAGGSITSADTVLSALNKLAFANGDYVSKSADQTINGTLAINSLSGFITVPTPLNVNDATPKNYVDSADALKVNKAGDTMTGALTITDTTDSTTSSNGSLVLAGAAGIAKNLNVGGIANFAGNVAIGLNGATPNARLDVDGADSSTGVAVNVENSTGGVMLNILNNGTMNVGGTLSGNTNFGNTGGASTTTIQSGTGGVKIGAVGSALTMGIVIVANEVANFSMTTTAAVRTLPTMTLPTGHGITTSTPVFCSFASSTAPSTTNVAKAFHGYVTATTATSATVKVTYYTDVGTVAITSVKCYAIQ